MMLLAAALLVVAQAKIEYKVYPISNPTCNPDGSQGATEKEVIPDKTVVNTCLEFGRRTATAGAYNSIKILGCSKECVCFDQVSAKVADAGCDKDKASGSNVKEACYGMCMQDCNGDNCGKTATSGSTVLALLGSGQICDNEQNKSEYKCETTGMIAGGSRPVSGASTRATPLIALVATAAAMFAL